MLLSNIFHSHSNTRLEGFDQETIEAINLAANKDFARRVAPGSITIFLLLLIAGFISDIATDTPLVYYSIVSLSFITIVLHFILVRTLKLQYPKTNKRGEIFLSILSLTTSAYWGIFTGWSLIQYGVTNATLVFLLFASGIGSGATVSIFIRKSIAQLYLIILLTPPILILITHQDNKITTGLTLGFTIYFIFLLFQVSRSNTEYWKALITTRELEIQTRELEKSNHVKTNFLANMSHELRTPMNAILGFAQLLNMDDKLTESQRRSISRISSAGENLLKLINEILDISKIEEGKLKLEILEFDLIQNIEDQVSLLAPSAQAKSLDFQLFIDPNLPRYVTGDSFRIQQILTNLISNAIKFTDEGKVSLVVTLDNSGEFLFEIIDEGIGIPAELQSKLFKPFTQADESTSRRFGGTGLGLAISQQLVTAMNGSIGIKSLPGAGTTFWFKLPLPIVDKSGSETKDDAINQAPLISKQNELNELANKKVLLVDDTITNQILAQRTLSILGLQITTALNGKEAIDRFTQDDFDLIIMDVQMPVMDGYTATKKIRQLEEASGKRHPIIAITANAMKEDKLRCINAGMDDYISKPFDLLEMQGKIKYWLGTTKN